MLRSDGWFPGPTAFPKPSTQLPSTQVSSANAMEVMPAKKGAIGRPLHSVPHVLSISIDSPFGSDHKIIDGDVLAESLKHKKSLKPRFLVATMDDGFGKNVTQQRKRLHPSVKGSLNTIMVYVLEAAIARRETAGRDSTRIIISAIWFLARNSAPLVSADECAQSALNSLRRSSHERSLADTNAWSFSIPCA